MALGYMLCNLIHQEGVLFKSWAMKFLVHHSFAVLIIF